MLLKRSSSQRVAIIPWVTAASYMYRMDHTDQVNLLCILLCINLSELVEEHNQLWSI